MLPTLLLFTLIADQEFVSLGTSSFHRVHISGQIYDCQKGKAYHYQPQIQRIRKNFFRETMWVRETMKKTMITDTNTQLSGIKGTN